MLFARGGFGRQAAAPGSRSKCLKTPPEPSIFRPPSDVLAVVALLVVALIVGFILSRIFAHYAQRCEGRWGEIVCSLLAPLPIPLLLAALDIALQNFALPHKVQHVGSKIILAGVLPVVFYFRTKVLLLLFLRRVGRRRAELERITEPASFVIKVLFALVAIIIFLENLGIHLTAVWTTLGIGSVAVALALQETLSNLFGGFYILADRPVGVGDYIKLDSGAEGFVTRVGWRSTALRTGANNMIVIPNSTIAKAVITNFAMPEDRTILNIPVSAAHGADPRRVE